MPIRASLQSREASLQREYCTMMTFISIIIRYTSLRTHTKFYHKGQDIHASDQKWIMCIKYKHYWRLHILTTAFLDNCLVNSQQQLVQNIRPNMLMEISSPFPRMGPKISGPWLGTKSITNHLGVTLTSFKSFRWTGDFDSSVTHLQTCHLLQLICLALSMCLKLNFTRFTAQI